MIVKNEIPILEYDDSSPEIIPPDHDWTAGRLPEKCLFAFLGDIVHKYAKEQNAEVVEIFQTVSYDIEIYVLHEGKIVERGKHEELLQLNGYYKRLNDMQSLS